MITEFPKTDAQIIKELRGHLAYAENTIKGLTEENANKQKRIYDLERTINTITKLLGKAENGGPFISKRANNPRNFDTGTV